MTASRPHFPSDHVVEALHEYPRPTLDEARRALVGRVHALERAIEIRSRLGQPRGRELRELAAIVSLVELAERMGPGCDLIGDGPAPTGWSEEGSPLFEGAAGP